MLDALCNAKSNTCMRQMQAIPTRRESEFAWGDEQDSDSDTEPDSGRDSSEDAALEAAYASPDDADTSDDESSDEDETLAARCAVMHMLWTNSYTACPVFWGQDARMRAARQLV